MTALPACVFCSAPQHLESVPIDHTPACPMTTGLYPNGDADRDLCCCACGDPFAVGDHYLLEPCGDDTALVVCVPCGLTGGAA